LRGLPFHEIGLAPISPSTLCAENPTMR
jgi:hypothetical protein